MGVTRRVVVVICGPAGAGKTTVAEASGLEVYDRDDPRWLSERQFMAALRRLASDPGARAVVIRTGATSSARARARALVGATHCFVLVEPRDVLRERVRERRRADFVQGIASIDRWFAAFDREDGVQVFPGWEAVLGGLPSVGHTSRRW